MNEIEIIEYYKKCDSLKETSAVFGIGWQKVRKILITDGVYTSEKAEKVKEMHDSGVNIEEISEKLNISKRTVNAYLPYKKTVYNKENPSKNATKIRKWRAKNKEKYKGDDDAEKQL